MKDPGTDWGTVAQVGSAIFAAIAAGAAWRAASIAARDLREERNARIASDLRLALEGITAVGLAEAKVDGNQYTHQRVNDARASLRAVLASVPDDLPIARQFAKGSPPPPDYNGAQHEVEDAIKRLAPAKKRRGFWGRRRKR